MKCCSLFSGSSGNSIFVEGNGTKILIDAGVSAVRIIEALNTIDENPMELSAILVTHEHCDHIKGARILSRKFNIPIYANKMTWKAMKPMLGKIEKQNTQFFEMNTEFQIENIVINAFPIPHDSVCPVGFNIFSDNKKLTIATDIGMITDELLLCFEKSDMILLESNHDVEMLKIGSYPPYLKRRILGENGHLSNENAGKVVEYLACRGTCKFLLGHLSGENNFPELAFQTSRNILCENPNIEEDNIFLEIAHRNKVGKIIEI